MAGNLPAPVNASDLRPCDHRRYARNRGRNGGCSRHIDDCDGAVGVPEPTVVDASTVLVYPHRGAGIVDPGAIVVGGTVHLEDAGCGAAADERADQRIRRGPYKTAETVHVVDPIDGRHGELRLVWHEI